MGDEFRWHGVGKLASKSYVCGHCGNRVGPDRGFASDAYQHVTIHLCSHCDRPTFFISDGQIPGVPPGNPVGALPPDIQSLYDEARRSTAAQAPTASVLTCRKLLAHIAVSLGDQPGRKFIEHIDFLAGAGYVPPNGKRWVDHIRKKGNEATHEIVLMKTEDAAELITFTEMLLKFVYEFPSRVPP